VFTEISDNVDRRRVRGWVLYDASCAFCLDLVERARTPIENGGFRLEPLPSPWVKERLKLPGEVLLAEMRVLTGDGRVIGGADALVYLAKALGAGHRPSWAWLLVVASKMPFGMRLLRAGYAWIAARRYCRQALCTVPKSRMSKKEGMQ